MYYSFSWVNLLRSALENPGEWGSSDVWNIHPVDEAPEKKAPPQTPHKKRRVLKTIPEDGDGHISAGSSSDNSGDDYQHQDDGESDDNEIPEQSDVPESEVDEAEDTVPQTPSKKRKRTKATSTIPSTPRRKRNTKGLAATTPHSKAALRARAKKKLTVRPPPGVDDVGSGWYSLENIPKDPWLRAMHVLHVASRPEALPCREEEYGKVLRAVEELVEEGSGGCVCKPLPFSNAVPWSKSRMLDISGVPGTGKTATVHAVVRELKRMAEHNVRFRPLSSS